MNFERFKSYFTSGLISREAYTLRNGEVVPAVPGARRFEVVAKGKIYRVTLERLGDVDGVKAPDDREMCEVIEEMAALVSTGGPIEEGGPK